MNRIRTALAMGLSVSLLAVVPASWAQQPPPAPTASELDARIDRLERILENQVLDILRRLDALQREIQELRGLAEQNRYELDQTQGRQRELYLGIDRRLRALEAGGAGAAVPPDGATDFPRSTDDSIGRPMDDTLRDRLPPGGEPAFPPAGGVTGAPAFEEPGAIPPGPPESQSAAPSPPADPAGAGQAYSTAFDLLTQGRYPQAIEAFSLFMAQYPQSAYSANAQYWLGEAYYVSRNFRAAAPEFQKVIENYPGSAKAADARLKLGFTYYELEQWDQARAALNEVRERHPGDSVAQLAEQRLQQMQREGH